MKNIGINGFGRIGRYFTRMSLENDNVNVAVVNDLADIKTLAHLFKYDSVHRGLKYEFKIEGNKLVFENGKTILFISERNPESIKWAELNVDFVLESTGVFRTRELASRHFVGGAKKVILSAPPQSSEIKTVVLGVNDNLLSPDDKIVSNASCTTNSAAPMLKVMMEMCEIESAFITTVHSYTSDQRLHDAPHKDLRRARAAAESIVPTTTGAAKALAKIFPELEGHIGGCGIRVPVPDGSMTDLTLVVKNPPTADEINKAMREAASGSLKGIMAYTEDPIVSVDVIGNPNSCIFDSQLTSVIGNMVKIMGWYDNEAGYSNRLLDLVQKI
ncbi:type I glyceraldehyde-3-phosphate dehydrogenase [Crocinitomicaceae bacterium]|nr:type I glyceraldehyde-3-phosphate dehydrogenase [Crocinitomicaceae bacterium]MDC1196158.1 type I glyceraldehyde-3-phosphate dehydrogenase [Crocinitomicaceae bacterium]MDC1282856.1 type I glyceraldehyde-3-phosphate dehydrogenase [Crocinitomicaceae bacterium]|tara:strand:- start:8881 stop:9870 length:990 start_codon:yes stop_codon:yes gene_type:complete